MVELKHLLELLGAKTKLSLWKADLNEEGSFDEAIKGCSGVFHLASPTHFDSKDPENEVIKGKTVRRLIFTSSSSTINTTERQKPMYDETHWSDVVFCRKVKMTGWIYFVSKILAEKEAWKFAKQHGMGFITIHPTLVISPSLIPTMPPSLTTAFSLITGNEQHYSIIKQGHFVHLDDVCLAHIFLFEQPKVEGRYICSACDATIHDIAKLINKKYPDYKLPMKFKNIPDELELVRFSSKRITDLGFQFKYSLEDMYTGAIDTCIEKRLLPKP